MFYTRLTCNYNGPSEGQLPSDNHQGKTPAVFVIHLKVDAPRSRAAFGVQQVPS